MLSHQVGCTHGHHWGVTEGGLVLKERGRELLLAGLRDTSVTSVREGSRINDADIPLSIKDLPKLTFPSRLAYSHKCQSSQPPLVGQTSRPSVSHDRISGDLSAVTRAYAYPGPAYVMCAAYGAFCR
jgi:hypothetical protein